MRAERFFPNDACAAGPPLSPAEFRAVAEIVHAEARISLDETKFSLVQSRLARRLRESGADSFRAYLDLVDGDQAERLRMVDALATNHSHFFRDNHHFEHLRAEVTPVLKARAEAGESVRLWSAGCATGEEIYSMAMVLAGTSRAEAQWLADDVRLLATDISQPMVECVSRARYPLIGADRIPLCYRAAWLQAEQGTVAIDPVLRAAVSARALNLFEPWPFKGRFDVIFCRNVMIHFDADARADLEQRLVAQLRPGGFLYLGHSERLSADAAAATVSCGQSIYRRREGE